MPYTPVTVSSYNSSPPADNGAAEESNRILWSGIKTKLGDPIDTAFASIDDNIATAISTITTNLATATSNLAVVQAAYTAATSVLNAPATTACLFKQTSAPTGWTKGATHNDKAIRLVSGTVSTGGSTAFSSVLAARTITSSNMPSHTHSWASGTLTVSWDTDDLITDTFINNADCDAGPNNNVNGTNDSSDNMTGDATASGTSGSTGSGTAMDFAVRYVDLIIATKDA